MSRTTNVTRLGRIQIALSEALIKSLKGEPLVDNDGSPIIVEGKPVLGPPKAAILKEAREYLKDMGITEEPEESEGIEVHQIAAAVKKYDDDQDALLNAPLFLEQKGT